MSVCEPNFRHLREVLIFYLLKTRAKPNKNWQNLNSAINQLNLFLNRNSTSHFGTLQSHGNDSEEVPNIHGAKVMLYIWWNQFGVVYYELLKLNETITGDKYRTQMMRMSQALKEKRSQYQGRQEKVIFTMITFGHMSQDRLRHAWRR